MAQNLKARLSRIRGTTPKPSGEIPKAAAYNKNKAADFMPVWPGWEEVGFKVYKRKVCLGLTTELIKDMPRIFPKSLAILVPDLIRLKKIPLPGELLFFDLETTGLSGGAGTLAFLAAFGRFVFPEGNAHGTLEITQYLLLDYPGEPIFLEMLLKEFDRRPPQITVSYNGKCFDSQILKNRCLINGIMPPDFYHADLLHPARRLWKRKLPDCSQSTIEVSILGLDRSGDVPGALAPEIWFSFLKNGENRELLLICEHNIKDILGLACLFLCMGDIAVNPLESRTKYNFDEEALALLWRKALKKNPLFFNECESCNDDSHFPAALIHAKTSELLLETAAKNGHPHAALLLAINAEWHLKDPHLALSYTKCALRSSGISSSFQNELEKRRCRLEEKISRAII